MEIGPDILVIFTVALAQRDLTILKWINDNRLPFRIAAYGNRIRHAGARRFLRRFAAT